ncbi:elongation factor P hydroxylase [Aidingimonas lacisalsi]|uniref:elongation factor P hydroxylase n=1 Tax=Aidingimonas lacisalsi TaxID=2604086 RepID=UPI0011D1B6C4|nr:elongation factor P hydroxylase [Aidingimonas lacisalsi]
MSHRLDDIIALFDGLFMDSYRTRLIRGDDEPLYLPADSESSYHRVIFAHGFYASALHEISHWCIAGARRRGLEDYGYWYEPDGRDAEQQQAFESVEVAPQALELLFSRACEHSFNVSVDNLGGPPVDRDRFRQWVEARAERFDAEGLPCRAAAFRATLTAFYQCRTGRQEAISAGTQWLPSLSASLN